MRELMNIYKGRYILIIKGNLLKLKIRYIKFQLGRLQTKKAKAALQEIKLNENN